MDNEKTQAIFAAIAIAVLGIAGSATKGLETAKSTLENLPSSVAQADKRNDLEDNFAKYLNTLMDGLEEHFEKKKEVEAFKASLAEKTNTEDLGSDPRDNKGISYSNQPREFFTVEPTARSRL